MMELLLIIIAPLLASLAIVWKPKAASWIGLLATGIPLLLALFLLIKLNGNPYSLQLPGLPELPFILQINNFTGIILLIVTFVSFAIFIYSRGYMRHEPGKITFWSIMSLFFAAMLLLVMAADWLSFIMGWEIMGFASYRLIGTWHQEKSAQDGANKAFMITRFTDLGLYLGIILLILSTGSSSIAIEGTSKISTLAGIFLLLAVMGKSAQVPFQSWLSAAMAGPTPVSALLHSATMVAAGVILLLKAYPVLPAEVLPWIGVVGSITIIVTAMTAIVSDDLKQMLAASTSSQLGFMLVAVAAGFPGAALAHLMAHAFMKSSLFLGAGYWQHGFDGTSFQKLSAAGRKSKFVYLLFLLAALGLAGVPPLIGYYSKDAVLAAGLKAPMAIIYFPVAAVGALLTAIYIGRALNILWKKEETRLTKVAASSWMKTGMAGLVVVTVFGGFILNPIMQLMDYKLPHATAAIFTGITAAVTGLAVGWFWLNHNFKGNLAAFVRNNYPIGGYQHLVVRPILQLAGVATTFENWFTRFILALGKIFYVLSQRLSRADEIIKWSTLVLGRTNLKIGKLSRLADDNGFEKAIYNVAESVKSFGQAGKKLQSGLVHQEMLWSVIGFIGFLVFMIFSIF